MFAILVIDCFDCLAYVYLLWKINIHYEKFIYI